MKDNYLKKVCDHISLFFNESYESDMTSEKVLEMIQNNEGYIDVAYTTNEDEIQEEIDFIEVQVTLNVLKYEVNTTKVFYHISGEVEVVPNEKTYQSQDKFIEYLDSMDFDEMIA